MPKIDSRIQNWILVIFFETALLHVHSMLVHCWHEYLFPVSFRDFLTTASSFYPNGWKTTNDGSKNKKKKNHTRSLLHSKIALHSQWSRILSILVHNLLIKLNAWPNIHGWIQWIPSCALNLTWFGSCFCHCLRSPLLKLLGTERWVFVPFVHLFAV